MRPTSSVRKKIGTVVPGPLVAGPENVAHLLELFVCMLFFGTILCILFALLFRVVAPADQAQAHHVLYVFLTNYHVLYVNLHARQICKKWQLKLKQLTLKPQN